MDGSYISRQEHEEFARRIDAEDGRQNRRISLLEETTRQMNDLTVSVKEMAVNMANMLEELKKQGERVDKLESEPAEAHKQIKMAVITALISAVVGSAVTAFLMLL